MLIGPRSPLGSGPNRFGNDNESFPGCRIGFLFFIDAPKMEMRETLRTATPARVRGASCDPGEFCPGIATQDWNQTGMSGRWVIDDPFPAPPWPSNRARWPCTGFPACWNATWCTDCRTVIYKQRRCQHGPGRDRVPRGILLLGGRPGQDSEPTVEVGPTDGITYSVPEFSEPVIRSGHSSTSVRFGPCLRENPSHFPFNSQ